MKGVRRGLVCLEHGVDATEELHTRGVFAGAGCSQRALGQTTPGFALGRFTSRHAELGMHTTVPLPPKASFMFLMYYSQYLIHKGYTGA